MMKSTHEVIEVGPNDSAYGDYKFHDIYCAFSLVGSRGRFWRWSTNKKTGFKTGWWRFERTMPIGDQRIFLLEVKTKRL